MAPLDQSTTDLLESSSSPEKDEVVIQDVAGWVLRIGVITSVLVMLLGLVLSCAQGLPSVAEMSRTGFSADFHTLLRGSLGANGKSIIDLGILLLVLTPIMRVAISMFLFVFAERDWFYGWVTFAVLVLTLSSLIFLK